MTAFLNFDRYSLTARFYPVLLSIFPLIVTIAILYPETYKTTIGIIISLAISCGVPVFFSNAVRFLGRKKEEKLHRSWGGATTTEWLRHRNENIDPITTERYHNFFLKHVPGLILPTPDEEKINPEKADYYYRSAIKWLLEHTRDKKKFPLVFKENITYGFRRNMYGVKPVALLIALLCPTIILLRPYMHDQPIIFAIKDIVLLILNFITAIFWIFIVSASWVKDASYSYTRALLAGCEKAT